MKFLLTASLLCIIHSFLLGQAKIGLIGGINLSKTVQNYSDSDEEAELSFRVGPKIGFVRDTELNDTWLFRTGLIYTSKGTSYNLGEVGPSNLDVEGYDRIVINYLKLPVIFGLQTGKVRFIGGLYFAMGLSAKSKYDVTVKGNGQSVAEKGGDVIDFKSGAQEEVNENFQINRYDFGFSMGLEYPIKNGAVNLSYNKGFSNLTLDIADDDFFSKSDFKRTNMTIGFSVVRYIRFN